MTFILDHLAIRCNNKEETAQYYINFLGYYQTDTFDIDIKSDGKLIHSIVLAHPNKQNPELFISDGDEGSIIDDWIKESGTGLHHMAFKVEKGFLDHVINQWRSRGIEFTTEEPITCPDGSLRQIFTKPGKYDNIVTELLERSDKGFCRENVAALVLSTAERK